MNISYPQPQTTTSLGSLGISSPSNTKPRLKKLSMNENNQEITTKSDDQPHKDVGMPSDKPEQKLTQESMHVLEENINENLDEERKKRPHISKRNFQTALDEEEQFGAIKKKVKALSDSETKASSPTLSRLESEKESEINKEKRALKENNLNSNVVQSHNKKDNLENRDQNAEKSEKIRIKCQNLSLFYSEDKKDILFKIEYIDEKSNQTQEKHLTRKQMVETNPLAALYYYENHLQFSDIPGFRPKFLQQKVIEK